MSQSHMPPAETLLKKNSCPFMAMTIPSGCSLAQQEHVPCCTTKTALEQLKEHIKETITVSKQPISTIH